jgi:hypothetical protein
MDWLQWGKASLRYGIEGWLVDELLHYSVIEDSNVSIWRRVISDYQHVVALIAEKQLALGNDFRDPRDHIGIPDPMQGGLFATARTSSQQRIPQNEWTIPYLLYAYAVKRTTFQRRLLAANQGPKVNRTVSQVYTHTALELYQQEALGLVTSILPPETPSSGLTLA